MVSKSQVKYIQSLGQKKFRDETETFVAEGPKIINELLGAAVEITALYATGEWVNDNGALVLHLPIPGGITIVKDAELERLSFLQTPNQVLGVFKKPSLQGAVFNPDALALMLDGVQDPGNMGTIIRIADWFGIGQVICSRDCADAFAPKVVQSTMGSIARVQVLYTELAGWITQHKVTDLYAATLHGTPLAMAGTLRKGMIVIGNEAKGISGEVLALCRHRITIPRMGKAESLNAAVATGIILSHVAG